jgi:hypothetical protein
MAGTACSPTRYSKPWTAKPVPGGDGRVLVNTLVGYAEKRVPEITKSNFGIEQLLIVKNARE